MPIVLCLRHPCAVVHSRTTLGWDGHLRAITSQRDLLEDHLRPWIGLIEGASSPALRQAILWCVETLVPLRQFSPGELQVVFYERFCVEPRVEIQRLFDYLRRPFDDRILKALDRPSWVSKPTSAVVVGTDRLGSWRRTMPQQSIEEVLATVAAFGLDGVYSKDDLPDPAAVEAILAS
jgi:hypothetical protein